uniref:Uncharacterized protein n=1 Tax=viral metagenome TaxID=1070528 RepID=A0A6C0CLX9_9ZZZZ
MIIATLTLLAAEAALYAGQLAYTTLYYSYYSGKWVYRKIYPEPVEMTEMDLLKNRIKLLEYKLNDSSSVTDP